MIIENAARRVHHGTWKLGQMYCNVQLAASHVQHRSLSAAPELSNPHRDIPVTEMLTRYSDTIGGQTQTQYDRLFRDVVRLCILEHRPK